jgi:cytochrome c553
LKAFRSGKREHEIMSVVARDLSDQEIADLSAWYASIKITAQMPE